MQNLYLTERSTFKNNIYLQQRPSGYMDKWYLRAQQIPVLEEEEEYFQDLQFSQYQFLLLFPN